MGRLCASAKLVYWTNKEIELIKECLQDGSTHREIADFIFEDFGIARTAGSVQSKCSRLGLKSSSSRKHTTEQYKKQIPEGIELLEEYVNDSTKILHKCLICTNEWLVSPNSIKQGKGCPVCAGNIKKTTEQYKAEIPNKDIELLGEYVNAHIPILHKCLICTNEWLASPHHIKKGHGCPVCANKAKPGYYGNMTKEQADALGYPLYLYNVKLHHGNETFYKIGLTKNEDRSRYNEYKPYMVIEEISFEKYDAWTAICKEEELKLTCNYNPKHEFGGHNECYI